MKILVMRFLGLGDVACIGIPALRLLRKQYPSSDFGFLTYATGGEIIALEKGLIDRITLPRDSWPDNLWEAVRAFCQIARQVIKYEYDIIYNFDTWFMPCFLARMLKDSGIDVRGNFIKMEAQEFLKQTSAGSINSEYVKSPKQFMDSTFLCMSDWYDGPWWERFANHGPYPHFYLNHCCGFDGELDMYFNIPPNESLLNQAKDRMIIALAPNARTRNRYYPFTKALKQGLEQHGYLVWQGFDGSIPLIQTLEQLRASSLVISVASAPQWLAAMVGCPAFIIPGPVPPEVLCPEVTVPKFLECQYCLQEECIVDRNYACMEVSPESIIKRVNTYLRSDSKKE